MDGCMDGGRDGGIRYSFYPVKLGWGLAHVSSLDSIAIPNLTNNFSSMCSLQNPMAILKGSFSFLISHSDMPVWNSQSILV